MNRFTAALRFIATGRAPEVRSAYSTGPGYLPGLSTLAGITVTPQTALTFTAVFAAINVLATDRASLPMAVHRRGPDGSETPEPTHPVDKLLRHSPNPEQNAFRFLQHLYGHEHGWGNGYAEIVRPEGYPVAFFPLNPGTTRPKRTNAGRLYYEIDDGRKDPLLPENVLHLAGLGFDGLQGYCPVLLGREAIGVGKAGEQSAATLFGNGAFPGGVLETPKRLSEVAAKTLRESWNRMHQGSENGNTVAVLEEGVTFKATQIDPDAAQFLASRAFQVLEIARLWRLPPHKLGDFSQSHLSNIEESNLEYLQSTLMGWICSTEAELNVKLFSEEERKAGYFIKTDLSPLMRGNMAARVAYYQGMRNFGAINADEIRSREGLNPIGPAKGGDLYVMQGQYVKLADIGKTPAAPPPVQRSDRSEEERYNPYHGKDGKFTGKHGGGKHGKIVPDKTKKPPEPAAPAPSTARDFAGASHAELKAHHAAMSADWRKSLSEDEHFDVRRYTGADYESINKMLRTGKGGESASNVKSIDKALGRSSLKEDVTLYRGVSDLGKLGLHEGNLKGAVIKDKAFMSTSLDRKVAEKYAGSGPVIRIHAKAGQRAASMAKVSRFDRESEVLFARGSALKIHGHTHEAGRMVIHAEIVQ